MDKAAIELGEVSIGFQVHVREYLPKGYSVENIAWNSTYTVEEADIAWAINHPDDSVDYGFPPGGWIFKVGLIGNIVGYIQYLDYETGFPIGPPHLIGEISV